MTVMNNQPENTHPQGAHPEQPTRATDPQASEISGNFLEGLTDAFSPDAEDKSKVRQDKPLEDTPQTDLPA